MCNCCNLVSGQEKDIGNAGKQTLYIERHNNTFSIKVELYAYEQEEEDETEINYCPMCGRKLGEEK